METQTRKMKTLLNFTVQNCLAWASEQGKLTTEVILSHSVGHGYEEVPNCWDNCSLPHECLVCHCY